jgi:hypothetical protein
MNVARVLRYLFSSSTHVLLQCSNFNVREGHPKAWEEKDIGGVTVLLSNQRWERMLQRFSELSGLGNLMMTC